MTLRHSVWSKLVVTGAVVFAMVLSIGVAQASNMGFKMNRVIQPSIFPQPKGQNLVALPYKNPYQTASDICTALGLSTVAPRGVVKQTDASSGITASYDCGTAGAFTLTQRVGLLVTNPTAAGGILVGSHQSNPPGAVSLFPQVFPTPKGENRFPVPYHTTSATAQALCTDLALPGTATVLRIDAGSGVTSSAQCGTADNFGLVLGEAVTIRYTGAPIVIAPGHPAHF